MANFGEMSVTLHLQVQGNMSDFDIAQTINNCQRQICESFEWSFLRANQVINSVTPRQDGVVTLTAGSPQVLGAGTTFNLNDVGSFLWAGGLDIAPIPIIAVQGAQMLTLSSPWPGPSVIGSGYTLAPLYYRVEGALEVRSVRSIVNLEKRTRDELNERDPARTAQGGAPAAVFASAPYADDGTIQIELWPVCTDARPYLLDIKRAAPLLVQPQDRPLCPSSVLEAKALMDACLSVYASTGAQQWLQLADRYDKRYRAEWDDMQQSQQRVLGHLITVEPPRATPFAWDAQWEATHDSGRPYRP